MTNDTFFVRNARRLMRRPVYRTVAARTILESLALECRVMPTVSGLVFQDYNANGTFDTTTTVPNTGGTTSGATGTVATAIDRGLGNVTVRVFDAANAVIDTVTTKSDGTWSSALTAANQNYRVEFSGLTANGFTPGPHGADAGTTTQFVADGATNVNLSAVKATDYFRANPLLVTTQYAFGPQTGSQLGILSFPYSAGNSDQSSSTGANNPLIHDLAVPVSQVGATYGLGFNRAQKDVLAAAYTKRHSNYGPGGAGTIYRTDTPTQANPATPSITTADQWIDLQGLTATLNGTAATTTIDVLGTFSAWAANRQGQTTINYWNTDGDNTGWNAVGKSSFGGLDVSDDGQFVYLMNLNDRRLYIISVNADGTPNTSNIKAYDIPTVSGVTNQNDVRPFAVQYHEGKVYIGLVDSAESTVTALLPTGNTSQLRGFVYAFDPATGTYSGNSVVSDNSGNGFSLSYARGNTYGGLDDFVAWSPTFNLRTQPPTPASNNQPVRWAQPMVSGLSFDNIGNLSISIRDRAGDQTGNSIPDQPGATGTREGISSGDILRAFIVVPNDLTSNWRLEANGSSPVAANPGTGVSGPIGGINFGPNDNGGPLANPNLPASAANKGGSFFGRDYYGTNSHAETSLGSPVNVPGFPDTVNLHFDPLVGGAFRTSGARWFRNTDGALVKGYQIYSQDQGGQGSVFGATFGKANGLGDLIAVESDSPPIEIGNRVFVDTNRNGIQDANEAGIPGVTVELWAPGGTVPLASVVTAADGSYYFNNSAAPGAVGGNEAYGIGTLTANTPYEIHIPNAAGGNQQAPILNKIITQQNKASVFYAGDTDADNRDSDAAVVGGTTGVISLTTGANGTTNHSFDIGFAAGLQLGNFVWNDVNNDGIVNNGETGIDGVPVRLFADANGDGVPDSATPVATTATAGGGAYLFTGLQAGKYVVEITSPAGTRSSTGNPFSPTTGTYESGITTNTNVDNSDHGVTVSGDLLNGFIVRTKTVELFVPPSAGNPDSATANAQDANLRQDFGLYTAFSLGNRVWLDSNNDGLLNNAEAGINNAAVQLYRPSDFTAGGTLNAGATPILTTSTANGGYYRFDNLIAGQYVVVVDGASAALSGLRSSTGGTAATTKYEPATNAIPAVGILDSDDNGTTIAGTTFVRTGVVTLGPTANAPTKEADLVAGAIPQGTVDGQADMTLDFGFFEPLSLGNRLFEDRNNNGKFDGSDVGIDGGTVRLFVSDAGGNPVGAALETQVTKNGGYYLFTGLGTGNYLVELDGTSVFGGGFVLSSTGQNGSLTGPNEPTPPNPNSNQTDNLDRGRTTTASGTGSAVTIRTLPVSLAPGNAPLNDGTTPGFTDLATNADSNLILDLGVFRPLSIGNLVWNDNDNNGKLNGAEAGINGVTVRLYQDNGDGVFNAASDALIGTTATNAAGNYLFTNLGEANYFVEIDAPAGFQTSTGTAVGGAFPYEPGINTPTDSEDHGTRITGQTIRSGLVTLTTGGAPTTEAALAGGLVDRARNQDADYTLDFGLFQTLTIGNFVWNDFNNNGMFDAGEPGIAGVAVDLLDANGAKIGSTTTDASGKYAFSSLSPADYQVRITAPAGFQSSTGKIGRATGPAEPSALPAGLDDKDRGTYDGTAFINAAKFTLFPAGNAGNPDGSGTANLRQDFGLIQPLSLGNFVWEDANNNGSFDAGEKALPGVTVTLLDSTNAVVNTTTTDANGNYLFTLLAGGSYTVRVTTPAGYVTSTGTNGSLTGAFEPGVGGTQDNQDHGSKAGTFTTSTVTLGNSGSASNPDSTGTANLRQDFGFYQPLSLGNFVWNDANNNGKLDGAEAGIDGVPVMLLDGKGAMVSTTTTAGGGKYQFDNLIPGTYSIKVTPPAGFGSSTGTPVSPTGPYEPGVGGAQDNQDHGTTAGAFVTTSVTLGTPGSAANPDNAGLANFRQDFGLFQSLSLGNQVWNDANNNGLFDAGEVGVPGVTVDLLDGNSNFIATTTTDANGLYLFPGLAAGAYIVRITPPASYISSTGTNGSATGAFEPGVNGTQDSQDHGTAAGTFITTGVVNLAAAGNPDGAGFANLRQDFGIFQPLCIGDQVFVDANNNGILDAGESGLGGSTVTLSDGTGAVVGTITTGSDGTYKFTGLIPGNYSVKVTAPSTTYASSTGVNGAATGPFEPGITSNTNSQDHGTAVAGMPSMATTSVMLGTPGSNPDLNGLANLDQDFGFYQPLSLGNLVFGDANNNGVLDAGETGIPNVGVSLMLGGATVGTTTTDANGNYLFANLIPGAYMVLITPPTGYATSTGKLGSTTGPNEPGLSDATDNADHGSANGAVIKTNVTLAAPGSASNPDSAGLANLRQDFGLFIPIQLGSFVWIDSNNNGKFDTGEQPVGNVPVTLYTGSGTVVATTTTTADGAYNFGNLTPGTYYVQITPPAGVLPSTPSVDPLASQNNQNVGVANGTTIKSATVTLGLNQAPLVGGNTDGNNYITFDFGLLALGSLSGFVYRDPDNNGIYNPGNPDSPIGAVPVMLMGTDGSGNVITRMTTTDSKGFYLFSALPPGTYMIKETQPAGLFDGLDTPGSLGGTSPLNDKLQVALGANQDGTMYNFGELTPAATFGYVWIDANRNCVYDAGSEQVVVGVPVTISGTAYAGSANARPLVASDLPGGSLTVLTDASGRYSFPLLPPGSYNVSRGAIPTAVAAIYADWCLQQGDPGTNPPAIGTNQFSNVSLIPTPIRGPFNFGLVPVTPVADPTKRDFLGSSTNVPSGNPNPNVPPPGGPTRGNVAFAPTFATTTGTPLVPAYVIVGSGIGIEAEVRVFDYATGGEKFRFLPYAGFTGGVRVAQGDVNGDGIADIITSTGVGGGPRVRVFDGATGATLKDFFAYEPEFRGGVFVASGDINGDGKADIITGTEVGGGPRVTVFDAVTNVRIQDFFAFDANQRGGVRVAAADIDGDGKADIVATTGAGVPTRVRVYSGATKSILQDFTPYASSFSGGANVGIGDINGDGTPDIIVGAEAGGGPRVQVYSGKSAGTLLRDFFAFDSSLRSGVRVAGKDVDGDGKAEIVATAGFGGSARVRVLKASDLSPIDDFFALDTDFRGGAFVG